MPLFHECGNKDVLLLLLLFVQMQDSGTQAHMGLQYRLITEALRHLVKVLVRL